jgi:peptidyl-prolyl cis-trans isomerase C
MMISRNRAYPAGLAALLMSLGVSACHPAAPKGQVVAVLNGQEITNQDLLAEARASQVNAPGPVLLQRVISRDLLADDAHARRLDAYPGFPADMARMRSEFIAQRDVHSLLKPQAPPSDAAVAQFIEAHPYAFGQRTRLDVDDVRFQSADDLRSIQGLQSLDQVVSRFKVLNVQYERKKQQLDTATVPAELASKLMAAPLGQLVVIRGPDATVALQVDDRQPVSASPEQQKAVARQLMVQLATQREVEGIVGQLRSKAHISYQPGYAPPSKTAERTAADK